ncbi:MAG: enoyl-CoA hydratase/isomerase family protein [Novosphingobium sp.]|nr:enoyl-CoA hydratase/isomerase family protein [Novosphingobium sp.]
MDRERLDGGLVVTVVIDNASRLNSLNSELMEELERAIANLAQDENLRAVVLTGTGPKAFIGGADIKEMATLAGPDEARAFITRVHRCCDAIRSLPVPSIARINGYTFGAGLEIAACCDFRIASENAEFGMPEVKLGIPSVVEAALLPMLIGWGRTRQMLLLGENVSSRDALAWGLIDRLVPESALDAAVRVILEKIMACAPIAVRLQKQLIHSWEHLPLNEAVAAGIDSFASAFLSDEPTVQMQDFIDNQNRRKGRET